MGFVFGRNTFTRSDSYSVLPMSLIVVWAYLFNIYRQTPPPDLLRSFLLRVLPWIPTSPSVTDSSSHVSVIAIIAGLDFSANRRNSDIFGKIDRTFICTKCRIFNPKQPRVCEYTGLMYPVVLEINDTTGSNTSASYLGLLLLLGRNR